MNVYPSLPHHVLTHAEERPDWPALIQGGEILDYQSLALRMRKGAQCLKKAGINRGSRVQIVAHNRLDLVFAALAAMAAGASVMPVSANEESLDQATAYFRPDLVLLDRAQYRRDDFNSTIRVMSVTAFDEATPGDLAELDPEDIGLLILTSGTTRGVRRGALLSHRALSGTAAYMNARMGLDGSVRDMVTAPLEHGFGMGRVRCALHLGGTAVLHSGLFLPTVVAEGVAEHRCNMLSAAVSAMTLLIDEALSLLSDSAARLRWIEMGTGHLPNHQREVLLEVFSSTRCFVSYGLTEAIRCTFLELNAEREKIHSVGTPAPGIRVRVVGAHGDPVEAGQEGTIEVSGVNMASGYFDQPDAWQDKRHGEWLVTGDVGVFDQDGYLSYVGRTDDMINVGGLKVAPQEVEEALADLMSTTPFAVARIPDPFGIEGHVPALFIESSAANDVTLDRAREHLRKKVPNFKLPRKLYRVRTLPRTSGTQKIRRAALAAIAEAIDQASSPDLAAMLARLSTHANAWPALGGEICMTRRDLAKTLADCHWSSRVPRSFIPLFEQLRRIFTTQLTYEARDILVWRELFPLEAGETLALAINALDTRLVTSLLLHALDKNAQLLLLASKVSGSLAADLGRLYQADARHVVVDSQRISYWAQARQHLDDGLKYSRFEQLVIPSPPPKAEVVARFRERFSIIPNELSFHRGTWSLRPIPVQRDAHIGDAASLWKTLRTIAGGVFGVAPESLALRSAPDNTPGWDSLGFVSLIAKVEEQLAIRLSPRDIALVASLGDMMTVVASKGIDTASTEA